MSELIAITPEQLDSIVSRSIEQTLVAVGIKPRSFKPYMSKAQAAKLVGRRRLESAIKNGNITAHYSDISKKTGRVYIGRAEVTKLLNNPLK
jgi:hypothetical protein